jgi:hypothetical protein
MGGLLMGINSKQFRELIVRPPLVAVDLWSESAEELLMGTCAQESAMGTYLKQLDNGIALGVYQMEPNTYHDINTNYLKYRPLLLHRIQEALDDKSFASSRLIYDLRFSTIMCRLHYLRVPTILPSPDDIEGLAHYWKKWYNTPEGKGTVDEFIANYNKYVK